MAPKLRKRPASVAGLDDEGTSKKSMGGAAGRKEMCGCVADAIADADLPKSVVAMLGNKALLKECLGVPKEDRHAFQEQAIQMVAEVLEGLEAKLKSSIAEAETKVGQSDTDKMAKEATEKAAAEAVEAKKAASEEAKVAAADAVAAAKAAKEALAIAESDQKAGDADLEAAAGKKERLEKAKEGFLDTLKAGTLEEGKVSVAVSELVAVAKEYEFDNTMITTMPSALSKASSERGAFDDMVFKQLEDALVKQVGLLADTIANGEAGKAERAGKVAEASAALEAADAAKAAKGEAKAAAAASLKEAEAALKAAAKDVKGHAPLMKQLQKDLETAKVDLEEFCTGTKATFEELVAFTLVPPEPEAPAAAEVPAETPAEPAPAA